MEQIELMNAVTKTTNITRKVRLYAVKELARRAGVTPDFFRSWRIDINDKETTIYVHPGSQKRIRFRHAPRPFWRKPSPETFHTARACWMHTPPGRLREIIPDFVVPFSHEAQNGKAPLFSPVDNDCVECALDLPVSTLLSLSRWEEQLPGERDAHGRFPSSRSVAVRDNFLQRPVVDEYGLAFEQVLTYLLPGWQPVERKLRLKLSHDIDHIGLPFNPKSAVGHTVRRRNAFATLRDLFGWAVGLNPTYLEAVREIVRLSFARGLDSAVYWKASPRGRMDSGYDPRHPKVRSVIEWLHEHGVESGVHPGYETFLAPKRLLQEVRALREVLGDRPLGGRQHWLRWCPETWRHWEECGLAYDSTVGFAEQIGFRAGTCVPYRPWLFSLNREARLIEIPLIVMDVTLLVVMRLTPQQGLEAVLDYTARCRAVGGVLTLLWHNSTLVDPVFGGLYEQILERLMGCEEFDWRTPSSDLY